MSNDNKVKIAYWNIRGLLEPIKLLCEYVGQPYELELFESRDAWQKVKATQPAWTNLPNLKDGDLFIAQSSAIMRHLGRKFDLCGSSEAERAHIDVVNEQVMDLRNAFIWLVYMVAKDKFDEHAASYKSDMLPVHLSKMSVLLGDDAKFFGHSDDKPSFADFHAYEMLSQHTVFEPTSLDAFPNLAAYKKRFEQLAPIASYLASDRFHARPINNPAAAHWF
jgi:glutathione S-transferase